MLPSPKPRQMTRVQAPAIYSGRTNPPTPMKANDASGTDPESAESMPDAENNQADNSQDDSTAQLQEIVQSLSDDQKKQLLEILTQDQQDSQDNQSDTNGQDMMDASGA